MHQAARQAGVNLPAATRCVGIADVDGTLYLKVEFPRTQLSDFWLDGAAHLQSTETAWNGGASDHPRLVWWKPERVRRCRFWAIRLRNGDGLHVLMDLDSEDRVAVFIHTFEL